MDRERERERDLCSDLRLCSDLDLRSERLLERERERRLCLSSLSRSRELLWISDDTVKLRKRETRKRIVTDYKYL